MARKNLGLFQHHDSITGTSQKRIMNDHRIRLENSINIVLEIQEKLIEYIIQNNQKKERNFLFYELSDKGSPRLIKITNENPIQKVVIFNSMATRRVEAISLYVEGDNFRVFDQKSRSLPFQINPIIRNGRILDEFKELLISVEIPGLSISILTILYDSNGARKHAAQITTGLDNTGELLIENPKMKLIFNRSEGFLEEVLMKHTDQRLKMEVTIGAYKNDPKRSGAYLFKVDRKVEKFFDPSEMKIIISNGPIASDFILVHGELLMHTIRIFKTGTYLDDAITIKNDVDFGSRDKNRMYEMFMKIKSPIENSNIKDETQFFTDQNGFQWMPRKKIPKLGVEANYYPITSSIFIQDESMRLTLITSHAHGASSIETGEMEVMLDRRTTMDDDRGMGEPVLDSIKMDHKFLLTFEFFDKKENEFSALNYQVPSLYAHYLINSLNNPINSFHVDITFDGEIQETELFNLKLPCDVNIINLKLLTDKDLEWLPSQKSLLILHRLGYECTLHNEGFFNHVCQISDNFPGTQIIRDIKIKQINLASLTGLKIGKRVKSLRTDSMEAMDIQTYLLSF